MWVFRVGKLVTIFYQTASARESRGPEVESKLILFPAQFRQQCFLLEIAVDSTAVRKLLTADGVKKTAYWK